MSYNITQLITRWKEDDERALDHLIAVAYHRLHTSARQALGYYGNNASIQTTELVNELYIHFRQQKEVKYQSAQHFFAVATLKLRQILNSRHEKNTAKKRDHGKKENLESVENNPGSPSAIETFILNDYLDVVDNIEPINARIAELKLFWEFDNVEIAKILDVSESTVRRKWKITKAIIAKNIEKDGYTIQ
ncbi:hypothetical protein TDB9533_04589 [Thalassocella blandensis]|nr:hypothetical protein TDB9533_04589 [Thalassocella blandensis]